MQDGERLDLVEKEPVTTFVALMFPKRNAGELIELDKRPDMATYGHIPEGIIYDFHRDYRGVTTALKIEDEDYFEGAQVIYGRFLYADDEWAYIQPVQFTFAPDRRSATQGYSDATLGIRITDTLTDDVFIAALDNPDMYQDLLKDRSHDRYYDDIQPPFDAYSWSFARMANVPK